jgi:uncharacterized protein with HEPN domain
MADVDGQDAVMRRLEIIGEAATKLTAEFTKQHDHVPWSESIGLRVILAHFLVTNVPDVERIWSIASQDIPQLRRDLFGGWPGPDD